MLDRKLVKYAVIAFAVWAIYHVLKNRTKNFGTPDPMAGGEF
jgi:hypothetical protein